MNVFNNLLLKLKSFDKEEFPKGTDYYSRYVTIAEYLEENVHPYVNQVAMIIDGGFLTDHGPEHIKTVISWASKLLEGYILTPYETYLLLVAIQFHDSGHIIDGRKLHERNAKELMHNLNLLMGPDRAERKYILKIVDAHGGKVLGSKNDKDKIGKLEVNPLILSTHINLRLIAATLRFADELADDYRRAARYLFDEGKIPIGSEVFHAYALALHSVYVEHESKEIQLAFDINKSNAIKKFGKSAIVDGSETVLEVYLLDEIFDRTLKLYTECIYCMQFFPLELQLNSVKIKIDITDDSGMEDIHKPISYRLRQSGYPKISIKSINEMCEDDLSIDGTVITGYYLSQRLTSENINT